MPALLKRAASPGTGRILWMAGFIVWAVLAAFPAAAQSDLDNATSVAEAWVTGIDGGDLGTLYDQYAGPTLRQGATRQKFIEQSGIVRIQAGGPAQARTLVGDQEFHQMPTGQQGTFHYFRYRAKFPSGVTVFEDVYLEKVNDSWKVAGVWLQPAQ